MIQKYILLIAVMAQKFVKLLSKGSELLFRKIWISLYDGGSVLQPSGLM